jgi:plasmid stability protein
VIAAESRSRALRWWVDRLPGQMKPFLPRLAARLVHKGVLIQEEHKLFGVFARTRLPERDHSLEAQTCERLRAVLLGERTPDADDAALTALVDAAGLVKSIVDRPQRAEAQRRAKEIGREDLVATAVRAAIKAANEAIAASTAATTAATI